MKIITDERCTGYESRAHPERPARIAKSLEKLRAQKELPISWAEPLPVEEEILLCAHSKAHLARLEQREDFDGDTPAYPNIAEHARRSVGGALAALESARKGETAFSLLRPPGHHATRDRAMGFCYLNSIAIAVLQALDRGASKVAVYDFDVHHGNGTEAILLNQPRASFFSIHQHPCYPGTGSRNVGNNCFNYPVAPHTGRTEYRSVLTRALKDLTTSKPELIALSAGFDAYARDPLAQETLEEEDYYWIGQSIGKLAIPVVGVLEGGYSHELPNLILAFLKGLDGR